MSFDTQGGISPTVGSMSGNVGDTQYQSQNPSASAGYQSQQIGVAGASTSIAPVITSTGNVSYSSVIDSAAANAALGKIADTSLSKMSDTALASILGAKDIADKAFKHAETPLQTGMGVVIPIVIAIAVVAGVYIYKRRS